MEGRVSRGTMIMRFSVDHGCCHAVYSCVTAKSRGGRRPDSKKGLPWANPRDNQLQLLDQYFGRWHRLVKEFGQLMLRQFKLEFCALLLVATFLPAVLLAPNESRIGKSVLQIRTLSQEEDWVAHCK